jgi:hypothetical protein
VYSQLNDGGATGLTLFSVECSTTGVIFRIQDFSLMVEAGLVNVICSTIGVSIQIGELIAGIVKSTQPGGLSDQETLVRGYCKRLRYELVKQRRSNYTVILHKSGLNVNMSYKRGGYIDFVQLGSAGYDLYLVADGFIKNNGARGFENWCVYGNQTQHGSTIVFS